MHSILSLSFLFGSLLLIDGAQGGGCFLTNPRPRMPPSDVLEGLPEPLQQEKGGFYSKSLQEMKKFKGKSGVHEKTLGDLPCGGIPKDRQSAQTIMPGGQLRVAWRAERVFKGTCTVTMMCPGGMADLPVWRGPCAQQMGDEEKEFSLPSNLHGADFGECFVQWKMETMKKETFVGCFDVIIVKPPRSTSSPSLVSTEIPDPIIETEIIEEDEPTVEDEVVETEVIEEEEPTTEGEVIIETELTETEVIEETEPVTEVVTVVETETEITEVVTVTEDVTEIITETLPQPLPTTLTLIETFLETEIIDQTTTVTIEERVLTDEPSVVTVTETKTDSCVCDCATTTSAELTEKINTLTEKKKVPVSPVVIEQEAVPNVTTSQAPAYQRITY